MDEMEFQRLQALVIEQAQEIERLRQELEAARAVWMPCVQCGKLFQKKSGAHWFCTPRCLGYAESARRHALKESP